MKKTALAAALSALLLSPALASDDYFPPVRDEIVKKECGACHLAFSASFLPASSWKKIMQGLSDHFGEDASLDDETARHITDYFMKNSEQGNFRNAAMKITELRWFVKEHRKEVSRKAREKAGSMANCKACHRDAERGYFDDD